MAKSGAEMAAKKAAKKAKGKVAGAPAAGMIDLGRTVTVSTKKFSVQEVLVTLSDGTKLQMRPVLMNIQRSLDRFNPNGDPIYQIQAGLVMNTLVPKKLKKLKKTKP